jgi:hypothetical protein
MPDQGQFRKPGCRRSRPQRRDTLVFGGLFGYFLAKQKVTKGISGEAWTNKKAPNKFGARKPAAHFFFSNSFFIKNDTLTLTTAPIAASTIVFNKSSE